MGVEKRETAAPSSQRSWGRSLKGLKEPEGCGLVARKIRQKTFASVITFGSCVFKGQ